MRKITVDVYNFSELSEEVQQKVIENSRERIGTFLTECDDGDYEGSLDAFCKEFDVSAGRWQVGCPTYYNLSFKYDEIYEGLSAEDVKGKLLWRFLDHHRDDLISPTTYYGWETHNDNNKKHRQSRVNYNAKYGGIVEDGMSLTGVYSDYELLKPIMEWRKHPDEDTSLYDLMDECLGNFFADWKRTRDANYEDEAVRDILIDNDSEQYCVDGSVFHGVY